MRALLALALISASCGPPARPDPWAQRSLDADPNPFGPNDPLWAPQPPRDRPHAAALSSDGGRLYVALSGVEDAPRDQVVVIDLTKRTVIRRITVGRMPVALALHPGGRLLVVANQLSNWLSVIDTADDTVVAEPPVPFYTTALAFAPDGNTLYMANRWKDAVLLAHLRADGGALAFSAVGWHGRPVDQPMGTPVSTNPDELVVSSDGSRVYAGSVTGLGIDVLDGDGAAVGRIAVGSPVGGMALVGPWLVASHIGRGNGYPPDDGLDGDSDGKPGDGTANVIFQDLQNELDVYDTRTLDQTHNYTTDNICCVDFRDVDPDDPTRGTRLPAPDTWPPSRVAFLPPKERWIVAGALPTRIARLGVSAPGRQRLLVIMSASDEAQRFDLDEATGALTAVDGAGHLYPTGYAPADVVARKDGSEAYVVDRLGESITVIDPAAAPGVTPARIVVGDESSGPFPSSDVEIGELINNVTAPFAVDGRQSCVHCHRDGGNLERVVAMPLQANRLWGSRQVQAYRGAYDTRPWFLEAAMDEKNFFPVLNEFARRENFCCEGLDPLVWSHYPPVNQCLSAPATPGCDHVLHCTKDPPPECAQRRYGSSYLKRDDFILAGAQRLLGRTTTFGDSLRLAGTADAIALDFDGITRSVGLFLLAAPRLPPNPNRAIGLPGADRGAALYQRSELGCANCHPLPVTTVAIEPDFSPSGISVRLPPVITPTLDPKGQPADLITPGFQQTFTVGKLGSTEQGPEGIHLGIPQLRGIWDRGAMFFHDGRARSLRSALLPPGHPALGPGERGYNERYGVIDTHGGTSQLSGDDMDDLAAFLLTL